MTYYELTYGANGEATTTLRFNAFHYTDAVTRMSEAVVRLDADPNQWAAHVSLKRLADEAGPEIQLVAWTKTSNERPTIEGDRIDA
ncbi:hypothetical protein CVO77_00175 [Sphingopyxis lindanitolerans]|uniref:Uncharacterized protein n=1 Tax=Sphingopyxis lindanitolerans TaxID=2054227 RepID=A0A2S8BAF4_9SPHN|nr:hypothetical protein [Sphingopyxis lindanitolerans]PQM29391.1 hypothetical protein CVO77_00175 [Sphingopyxis lindanitolerans]